MQIINRGWAPNNALTAAVCIPIEVTLVQAWVCMYELAELKTKIHQLVVQYLDYSVSLEYGTHQCKCRLGFAC